jgi:hypothetical protein
MMANNAKAAGRQPAASNRTGANKSTMLIVSRPSPNVNDSPHLTPADLEAIRAAYIGAAQRQRAAGLARAADFCQRAAQRAAQGGRP